MDRPSLVVLDNEFSIHRLGPAEPVPAAVFESPFYWLGKTADELSVVCDASIELSAGRHEPGWSCLEVCGPIDFAVTGLIAGLSGVLASAGIGVFVISTFDTDYVLVKSAELKEAAQALQAAGYEIEARRTRAGSEPGE